MDVLVSHVTREMIFYFDGDVKRISHALKVYAFAKSIGELTDIGEEKLRILELSAILHDIGIKESEKKYASSAARYQEAEGPPVARFLLSKINVDKNCEDRICYIIGHHHTYGKIDDIDFQILVEADFLVNIAEGDIQKKEIGTIRQKYFKTNAGISFLDSMYGK